MPEWASGGASYGPEIRDSNVGLDSTTVNGWLQELGWETLVNKRSTTWKGLSPVQRETMDADMAQAVIMEQPTLIKRPLLDTGKERHTGALAGEREFPDRAARLCRRFPVPAR